MSTLKSTICSKSTIKSAKKSAKKKHFFRTGTLLNEKEQLEKLRLLAPGLDDLKLQLNVCNFYGGVGLSGRTGPIGFPGKRYPLLEERCYTMYILIGFCHIALYTSKMVKVVSFLAT